MNLSRTLALALALLFLGIGIPTSAQEPPLDLELEDGTLVYAAYQPAAVIVTLVDGSVIKGVSSPTTNYPVRPADAEWVLESEFGTSSFPLIAFEQIDRVAGKLRVTFTNGDCISGKFRRPTFPLLTIAGHLEVKFELLEHLVITRRGPPPPPAGPILHHDFRGYLPNEVEGKIEDLSGNERTGRFVGSDLHAPGVLERSFFEHRFDRKSPLYPIEQPFSVVMTFRTSYEEPGEMLLWSTHSAGAGTDGGWLMVDTDRHHGRMRFFLGPEHTEIVGETVVNDGQWHTAVARWDGETISLFVDGECEGTAATSQPLVYSRKSPLRFGHTATSGAAHAQKEKYYFRGEIGQVWIYDRALAKNECAPRAENEPSAADPSPLDH